MAMPWAEEVPAIAARLGMDEAELSEKLEELAQSFEGVGSCYALRAGRGQPATDGRPDAAAGPHLVALPHPLRRHRGGWRRFRQVRGLLCGCCAGR